MKGEPQDWPKAVIFDLDGTLIDSAPDIAHALNRATEKQGIAPFGLEQVKEMIGGGVPKLVQRALLARGLPADGLMPLVQDFIVFYREESDDKHQALRWCARPSGAASRRGP